MAPYKKPYANPVWSAQLRPAIYRRDRGTCQANIAKNCIAGEGQLTLDVGHENTMRLGHIVPWRDTSESRQLHWYQPSNLRTECKYCSSAEVMIRRRKFGWQDADAQIALVVGPPCGDQTRYVIEHATAVDLVIDFDVIAKGLGSQVEYDHGEAIREAARAQRSDLIQRVQSGDSGARVVWLTSSAADAVDRFPHHQVIVCDPGQSVALERAVERGDRWVELVEQYYTSTAVNTWTW